MTVSTPPHEVAARPPLGRLVVALRPRLARSARWRPVVALAWVVGAVAGVAPAAFLGDPAPGLGASALLGLVGVAVASPVLVVPVVASFACDDDTHQAAAAWHAVGVDPATRLAARALAAGLAGLRLLGVGAVAGLAAGVGLALGGPDDLRLGLGGAPSPVSLVLALALLPASWLVAALVAAAAGTTGRALLALVAAVLATGAVASLGYFSPGLRQPFWATPLAALWPFDPSLFDSAQFAVVVPPAARVASGTAWLAALALLAVRRRRREPYPLPGEARPRPRR